ncbi:hypothetical protein Tco_0901388 [Tanacetum coccineum]
MCLRSWSLAELGDRRVVIIVLATTVNTLVPPDSVLLKRVYTYRCFTHLTWRFTLESEWILRNVDLVSTRDSCCWMESVCSVRLSLACSDTTFLSSTWHFVLRVYGDYKGDEVFLPSLYLRDDTPNISEVIWGWDSVWVMVCDGARGAVIGDDIEYLKRSGESVRVLYEQVQGRIGQREFYSEYRVRRREQGSQQVWPLYWEVCRADVRHWGDGSGVNRHTRNGVGVEWGGVGMGVGGERRCELEGGDVRGWEGMLVVVAKLDWLSTLGWKVGCSERHVGGQEYEWLVVVGGVSHLILDGTDTESDPFEDPIDTKTRESPLAITPPILLSESTPPVLVPSLRSTARMAVRVPHAMLSGLFTSMAEVAAMSESAFYKRFRSSYDQFSHLIISHLRPSSNRLSRRRLRQGLRFRHQIICHDRARASA